MSICIICGLEHDSNSRICKQCFENLMEKIDSLKPSTLKDITVEEIFPTEILHGMRKFLKKDILETSACLSQELWTATVLMASRILEIELKTQIKIQSAKHYELADLGQCIRYLESVEYPPTFIELVESLRNLRNDAMHGNSRFSSESAMGIFKTVMKIVAWFYNLEDPKKVS